MGFVGLGFFFVCFPHVEGVMLDTAFAYLNLNLQRILD